MTNKTVFLTASLACAALLFTANSADAAILYGTSLEKQKIVLIDTASSTPNAAVPCNGCTVVLDTAPYGGDPDSLLIDSQFRLIYDTQGVTDGKVWRFDPNSPVSATNPTLLATGLKAPQDMTFDPGGASVLVANFLGDTASGTISRVNLAGPFPNATLLPLSAVPRPNGIAYDSKGNLFVFGGFLCNIQEASIQNLCGTTQDARLYQISPTDGHIIKISAAFDPTNSLDGLVFDPFTGFLFGTSRNSGNIYKIDPAAFLASANGTYNPGPPFDTGIPTSGTGVNALGPDGIMSDTKGLLYVANRGDFHVYSCSATTAGSCSQLNFVSGIDDLAQIVLNPPVVTKQFSPNPVSTPGAAIPAISTLTITLTNSGNPTTTLNNVTFDDPLPAGVTVASTPHLTNNCGGTFTPAVVAGSTVIHLSGVTLAGGASCHVTVDVSALAGTYPNKVTVAADIAGPGTPGTDTLVVITLGPPVVKKTFSQSTIPLNGTTRMTITFSNPNATAVVGAGFNDPLPAAMVVAATPNLTNTCGGTFTPAVVGGSTSINLSGVNLGAAGTATASCTVSLDITGIAAGGPTGPPFINCATPTSTPIAGGVASCAPLTIVAPPVIQKSFSPTVIPINGTTTSTMTFILSNPAANTVALTGVGFTDLLPSGIVIGPTPLLTNTCGGTITPATLAGATSFNLSGVTLPVNGSCTITVQVIAAAGATPGLRTNTTSAVTSTNGGPGNTGTAQITLLGPPSIVKSFVPGTIQPNGVSTLTFTITNPNPVLAPPLPPLTGIGFSDTLPAGMTVASSANFSNTCGGTFTPQPLTAAATTIQLTGAQLNAGQSCVVSFNVTASGIGSICNTTSVVSSTEAGNGPPSTACLTIAGPPSDAFQLRYAAHLDQGDSLVIVSNAGSLEPATDPGGTICVNTYTFDPNEEMVSCCSCKLTPNGVASLSVLQDLVSDQSRLARSLPTSITIKLLASTPVGGVCNAGNPTANTLAPGMRAWGTTLHPLPGTPTTYTQTETPFARGELSPGELTKLTTYCHFIQILGGGKFGVCNSCRPGALGATAQ